MCKSLRWPLIVILALLSVAPRLFYLEVPFERDEGAYAYISNVIDKGGLPYLDAFDNKPPGIYYLYNLSMNIFGNAISSPRLMAAVFVVFACVLTFILVFRLTSSNFAGILSMTFLGIASSSPAYTGFAANTEIFIMPFLIGAVTILSEEESKPLGFLTAGLLFGAAFMIKQPAAVIAFSILLYSLTSLVRHPRKLLLSLLLFISGFSVPLFIVMAYFAAKGGFEHFWAGFLTYNFGRLYGPGIKDILDMFLRNTAFVLKTDPVTWISAAAGIVLVFILNRDIQRGLLFSIFAGSAAAVALGELFAPHYFIFMLPFLVISIGMGTAELLKGQRKNLVLILACLMLTAEMWTNIRYLRMSSKELLRICYGSMPFYHAKIIGDFLKKDAGAGRSAFIIGSEAEILYYAGLKSPTRIFYFYPLAIGSKFQESFREEVLSDLKRQMPDYVIFVPHLSSFVFPSIYADPFLPRLFALFNDYNLTAYSSYDTDKLKYTVGSAEEMKSATILVFKKEPPSGSENKLKFGNLFH